jgi:hypothetical protein
MKIETENGSKMNHVWRRVYMNVKITQIIFSVKDNRKYSGKKIDKRKENEKDENRENWIFSRKCSGKILQGGYHICSDTML